jgi:uncharacterized protein (DUF849 family)
MGMVKRLVACLNGGREPGSHPALPLAPGQLAAATLAVLGAGATEVHVHPRDSSGAESLRPGDVAAVLDAIRAAAPGTPVSVTTNLLPQMDAARRAELISGWTVWPDLASVNIHEPGAAELVLTLERAGVGVEAGLWTPEAARLFVAAGLADRCRYVLIEPMDAGVEQALSTASAVGQVLDDAGVALPRLVHGQDHPAWDVLAVAAAAGHDVRIGLEDTLCDAAGRPAADNRAQILEAGQRLGA